MLTLEGCQFTLEVAQAPHRGLPTLLKGGSDQTVVGIDSLVATFRQIGLITGSFDPSAPLLGDGLLALLERGERRQGKLDRRRSHRADQTVRDRLVQRRGRDAQAGMAVQGLLVSPGALVDRIDASVAAVADGQAPATHNSIPWSRQSPSRAGPGSRFASPLVRLASSRRRFARNWSQLM